MTPVGRKIFWMLRVSSVPQFIVLEHSNKNTPPHTVPKFSECWESLEHSNKIPLYTLYQKNLNLCMQDETVTVDADATIE